MIDATSGVRPTTRAHSGGSKEIASPNLERIGVPVDVQHLGPGGCAADHADIASSHSERPCNRRSDGLVCRAIDRPLRDGDHQLVVGVATAHPGPRCARLHPDDDAQAWRHAAMLPGPPAKRGFSAGPRRGTTKVHCRRIDGAPSVGRLGACWFSMTTSKNDIADPARRHSMGGPRPPGNAARSLHLDRQGSGHGPTGSDSVRRDQHGIDEDLWPAP